jgi:hypothetical protein
MRAAIATHRGSCSWDVDHACWLATLHSAEKQDFSGTTLEEGLARCLVWLMATGNGHPMGVDGEMSWRLDRFWTNGDQSAGSGMPNCQCARLQERRNTSLVRLKRPVGSSGPCRFNCSSMTFARSTMDGSAFSHSTVITARQGSHEHVILFMER